MKLMDLREIWVFFYENLRGVRKDFRTETQDWRRFEFLRLQNASGKVIRNFTKHLTLNPKIPGNLQLQKFPPGPTLICLNHQIINS